MPPTYKYFTPEEVIGLDPDFVAKLDLATAKTAEINRENRRVPFIITSGFRSPEANKSIIGSVPDSAHTKGLAVDMRVYNSHEVWVIVEALAFVGINRVGIYVDKNWSPIHIHCDVDSEKIDQVLFIKQEAN